jgi:hypothetical protein
MTEKLLDVTGQQRRREPLSVPECMHLLGTVSVGRVVFSARALPAVRPVNHLVEGGRIIIRVDDGAPITSAARAGTIVAYEADQIDPDEHLGWSVVVVGAANRVTDADEAAAYCRSLRPWVSGAKDQVIAIRADMVTGFRLVADRTPGPA